MDTLELCSFVFLQHFHYYLHGSFEINTELIFIFISTVARLFFYLFTQIFRKLDSL